MVVEGRKLSCSEGRIRDESQGSGLIRQLSER